MLPDGNFGHVRRVLIVALCLTSLVLVTLVTVAGTPGPTAAANLQESRASEQEPPPVTPPPDEGRPPATHDAGAGVPELPACEVHDEAAMADGYDDWRLTLLDTRFAVPETYHPPDLVALAAAFPAESAASAGGMLREFVIEDLRAMVSDAAAAGHFLAVQSA